MIRFEFAAAVATKGAVESAAGVMIDALRKLAGWPPRYPANENIQAMRYYAQSAIAQAEQCVTARTTATPGTTDAAKE